MTRNANDVPGGGSSAAPKELLAPGNYPARVVQVIFQGVQTQKPYQGKEKPPIDEVRVTYELSEEFMKDEDGNILEDKPRWVSERFPFHNLKAERAKSTLRLRTIDPSNTSEGDWSKLLGMPCQVCIVNNPGKGKNTGKTFENVGDVSGAVNLKGYTQPELVNAPVYFDPQDEEHCDVEVFRSFPEFLQETIKSALDYEGSPLHLALGGDVSQPAKEEAPEESKDPFSDDEENPY